MGKGSGKRATRERIGQLSAATREDDEQLRRAATRRLAKLEKDLAAAHKMQDRRRSRLEAATAEVNRLRSEIAGLIRHASEPAMDGASKVGHAAGDLLEEAADAVADAAGSVVHAAGSVVGAARRSVRAKPAPAVKPAGPATPPPMPAEPEGAAMVEVARPATSAPAARATGRPSAATPVAPKRAKPAKPRSRRGPTQTPAPPGPDHA
jgi:ElaB/YqjD/DUF883 family membrane-anchored ribosome-binding protein